MKSIKSILVVLATALSLAVASTSFAADSFSPSANTKGLAVSLDATTHLQLTPPSFQRIVGYTTNIATDVAVAGTNHVLHPAGPSVVQYITAFADVNLVRVTNTTSSSSAPIRLIIDPNGTNRLLTIPTSWKTNAGVAVSGITVTNATYEVLDLFTYGTNVFVLRATVDR